MALSKAAKKPIVIHCRDAWPDCIKMLEEEWAPSGLGGILHCFSSSLEDAKRGIDIGFMISFAGNSTFPKAQNLRDIAKVLPLENILIETDAPYLAEVAKMLASVRNLSTEEAASATTENFRRFFGLTRPHLPEVAESH